MYKQLKDATMKIGYVGGWCLKFVQDAFGTDHPYPTAIAEWDATSPYNHTDRPPAGVTVPVFFSLGNVPAGHVAISLNDGFIASSTQAGTHATPYFHKNLDDLIAVYGKYNGGATYLGWSEMVGSVRVVEPVNPNATREEVIQAYKDILDRDPTTVDEGGITHYENYPIDVVRQNLLDSVEYKTHQAIKQAQAEATAKAEQDAADATAQAIADVAAKAQADADAKAKADADAANKAALDTAARQKALDAQAEADAVTSHVQNPVPKAPVTQPVKSGWQLIIEFFLGFFGVKL